MKFTKTFNCACIALIVVFMMGSCKKNQSSGWNTQLLVPIATTSLSLQNLVTDSSAIKTGTDSSLTLSYQSTLYNFSLADEIVQIPDTSIGQKFNLDSLSLPSIHLNFLTTLGSIAEGLGTIGTLIIGSQGDSSAVGPLSIPSVFQYGFDASGYFDSAVLVPGGQAQVWAVNDLPVTIAAGTSVMVMDSLTQRVIQDTTFPAIPANDSIYMAIPLKPGKISSHLYFVVGNINTLSTGTQKVLIDTLDNIRLRVFVANMHVSEAWAKFGNQSILDQTNDVAFNFGDRKFTYIDARAGHLHITIYNSVPQKLYLQYNLVGAYNKLGQPLVEFTNVDGAVNGVPGVVDTTLDITGYSINLTGQKGSSFNTYTQRVITNLDSTGQTQHIILSDSLNVKYALEGIKPNYIKGYIGKDTITTADSSAFNFLGIFKSGSINLQSVNMNFNVSNNIGVDGQIKINSLSATNSNNHITQYLTSPTILGKPLTIKRATDFPLTPAVSSYSLNNSNSNIKDLINILPNRLDYNIQVKTNVNGNTNQYRDFAYLQSGLQVSLDAEIPLSLVANSLTLQDTIAFNLANTNTSINGVSDGIIYIIAENKYPIQAVLTMIIYDGNWQPLDTLAFSSNIAAGVTDATCRVRQPTQSVLQEYVNDARMTKLKLGQHAVITTSFSTVSGNQSCNGQHLKIYSDYTVGITLSAKFNYKVNTKF